MIPPRPLGSVVAGGHSTCHGRQQLTTEFLTDHTRIAQGAFHNRGQQCTNLGTMQQPQHGGGGGGTETATLFGGQLRVAVEKMRQLGAQSGWHHSVTEELVHTLTSFTSAAKDQPIVVHQPHTSCWWPHLITPGAVVTDGSQGIKSAFSYWWEGVPQYGDYAHVYFLFAEGRYLPKSHPLFEHVHKEVIPQMHTCQTCGAWVLLSNLLAQEWQSDALLMDMHQRLFHPDHPNPWYIGVAKVGGVTVSNNVQEVRCSCSSCHLPQLATTPHTCTCHCPRAGMVMPSSGDFGV